MGKCIWVHFWEVDLTVKATWHETEVAVKRIKVSSDIMEKIFMNECKLLSRLKHRNILQFIGNNKNST